MELTEVLVDYLMSKEEKKGREGGSRILEFDSDAELAKHIPATLMSLLYTERSLSLGIPHIEAEMRRFRADPSYMRLGGMNPEVLRTMNPSEKRGVIASEHDWRAKPSLPLLVLLLVVE